MVRLAHGLAAGAVTLALAGAWLAAGEDEPLAEPAAVTTVVTSTPAAVAGRPAPTDLSQWALGAAAAKVCADGCDEQPAPTSQPAVVVAGEEVPLPVDLDAWALSPEPLRVATAPAVETPLFNTPPAPDENDPTPADESDPYAAPAEQAAPE